MVIHIRDAKEEKSVEPSMEDRVELGSYERLMARDTGRDLITPHEIAAADSALKKIATYPCPDFTIPQRPKASTIPPIISNELVHLPHLSTPGAWIQT